MLSCFRKYLLEKAPFSEAELDTIAAVLHTREIQENEIVFEEGTHWRYNAFVCKGLIYSYTTELSDTKKIVGLSPENYWIGDRNSLLKNIPIPYTAVAYETTTLIYIENHDFEQLRITIPNFNDFAHTLIQRRIQFLNYKQTRGPFMSDQERFSEFVVRRPGLYNRVIPEMIASYLEIDPKNIENIIADFERNNKSQDSN